jgi:hypothetical protein
MPTATVEVAYVNEPKPGKKMGSIKATNGTYYGVWPDKLNLFEPGRTYEIIYTTSESGFHNFKSMAGPNKAAPAKANGAAHASNGQSKDMFKMGAVGRWCGGLGAGGSDFPDVNKLAEALRDAGNAWDLASATKPVQDLNDDIPF